LNINYHIAQKFYKNCIEESCNYSHEGDITVVVTTDSEFKERSAEGKEQFWCNTDLQVYLR